MISWIKEKIKWIVFAVFGISVVYAGVTIVNLDPNDPESFMIPVFNDEEIEKVISEPILPITQIEDEYFEIDKYYNKQGFLYVQNLYAEDLKLKKDNLSEIKDNLLSVQLEDTDLLEAEVLTLYIRGKGDGTAILKIGVEEISLNMDKNDWLTKWDSLYGKWSQEEINNAYIEFTGDIRISNVRLYVEDQHSLTDNFDAYNDGDLNGQGSWSGDTRFDVSATYAQGGSGKGVGKTTSSSLTISKSITPDVAGKQGFWMMQDATGAGRDFAVYFYDGATWVMAVYYLSSDDDIKLYWQDSGTQSTDLVVGLTTSQWYNFEVEWDASANTINARVDGGSWIGAQSSDAFTDVDKVTLLADNTNGQTSAWDNFYDPDAPVETGVVYDDTYFKILEDN